MAVTEEQKVKWRKVRGLAGPLQDTARNILVNGCIDQGAYIQFGRDLVLYNLWEALLYAQSYEKQGMYAEGTVQKVLDALK